jgi:signal transduction histidine kinase
LAQGGGRATSQNGDDFRGRLVVNKQSMERVSAYLRPQSWAGSLRGFTLALGCGLALILIDVFEVLTPRPVTISAVVVFPVLVAAWLLSRRVTLVIAGAGMVMQAGLAWSNAIDWITAGADIAALALMATIAHFAGKTWLAMHRGLERERALLQDRERSQVRLEALLEVAHSILEGMSVEQLMELVASRARTLAGSAMAAVAVPDEDPNVYLVKAVDGVGAVELRGSRLLGSRDGRAASKRHRGPLVATELIKVLGRPSAGELGLGTALLFPLTAGRRRIGTLLLANLGTAAFEERERALVEQFAAQAAVALEHARVRDELQRLALLEDRERISHELHDGVIQSLFAIGLDLEARAKQVDRVDGAALTKSVAEINTVIRDLRGYIYGMLPGVLYEHDLGEALVRVCDDFTSKLKIRTHARIDPEAAAAITAQGLQVVQFATEALSNVARHSGADSCILSLRRSGAWIELEVRDEGRGFDPARARGKGIGLQSLGDRAARVGGRFELDSAAGRGTTIRLLVPGSLPKPGLPAGSMLALSGSGEPGRPQPPRGGGPGAYRGSPKRSS